MRPGELVTLTMRELDRLKMVQAVAETGLKPGPAAERLARMRGAANGLYQNDHDEHA